MSVNRMFAGVAGAVYLIVGLVGFAVTSGVGFAARNGDTLLGFELNPLHNIVHLGVGLLFVAGAVGSIASARSVNMLVGWTYAVVGIVGLFALGEEWNILALNQADNVLHLGTAAAALIVAMTADRGAVAGRTHLRRAA